MIASVAGGGKAQSTGVAVFSTEGAGVASGFTVIYFLALAIARAIMASFCEGEIAPLALNSAF